MSQQLTTATTTPSPPAPAAGDDGPSHDRDVAAAAAADGGADTPSARLMRLGTSASPSRLPPPLVTHVVHNNYESIDSDSEEWTKEHDNLRQAVMSAYAMAGTPSHHHPSTLRSSLLASASRGGSTRDLHAVAATTPVPVGGSAILGLGNATTIDNTSPVDDDDERDGYATDGSSMDDEEEAFGAKQEAEAAEEQEEEWNSSTNEEDDDDDDDATPAAKKQSAFFPRRESRHRRIPSYAHLFPPAEAKIPTANIENHGVIGNLLTCALVSTDANIDWMAFPHFDSPPIFHSLLDAQHGGHFKITAGNELPPSAASHPPSQVSVNYSPRSAGTTACVNGQASDLAHAHRMSTRQMYYNETNCLLTRFFTESGVGHVTDFLPLGEAAERYNARSWLVREVEVVRGKMYFEVDCTPSFDWGRKPHKVKILPHGALFVSDGLTMLLTSSRQRKWTLTPGGKGVKTRVKLQEGQRVVFVLREWREAEERDVWEKARLKREQAERQKRFMQAQIDKIWAETHAAATGAPVEGATASTPSNTCPDWGEEEERNRVCGTGISPLHSARSIQLADLRVPTPKGTPSNAPRVLSRPSSRPTSATASSRPTSATASSRPTSAIGSKTPSAGDGCGVGEFGTHTIQPIPARRTDRLRRGTMEYWANWLETCEYTGRWREVVRRSALVLKLLTFEPTGAIIQAPTCCLPNSIGKSGSDYRFVSLRDASFTAAAFLRLGFRNEMSAWMGWLAARCEESQSSDGKMQQLFGLRGETDLTHTVLPDVPGYKGSGPVSIGNTLANRSSIDHYGAILIAMYLSNKYCEPMSYETWTVVRKFVSYACKHWNEPVEGLWADSVNREPNHYVIAKLMCWVCVDRGIHLAQDRSFPGPLQEWRRVRDEIYYDIQERGYNHELRRFTAAYDNTHLDVGLLLMPITSFVAPTDPKFLNTLDAILKSVTHDGLMSHSMLHRYNVLDPTTGEYTFPQSTTTIGSFWAIEACTRGGLADKKHLERARMLMEQMIGYTNHVGLYSECISLRGEFTGHYPHGLTHVALMRAAMYLDSALSNTRPTLLETAMYQVVEATQNTPHS